MSNLTITIDDETLKKARMRALTQGTSVNAVLRQFLKAYAGARSEQEEAVSSLLSLSQGAQSRRGGKRWTRESLYERG